MYIGRERDKRDIARNYEKEVEAAITKGTEQLSVK